MSSNINEAHRKVGLTPEERTAKRRARKRAWHAANRDKAIARNRARFQAHPEKIRAYNRARYQANREKVLAAAQARYAANPEKVLTADRARRAANPEKARAMARARYQANPEKSIAAARAWSQAHPEKVLANSRATHVARYGMTLLAHEAFRAAHGYCCAACGKPEEQSKRKHHTDHDHATNVVRGLLCAGCNTALGLLKDDPQRLRDLADYLDRSRE